MAIRKNAARADPILVPCAACPLRRQDIFKKATAEEIAFIQQLKVGELVLPPGSLVMREDIATGEHYTLLSGWAFRFRTLSSGARQILNFLLPGDFLGLQEKLEDKAAHGVELLTDAVLCRFPGNRLFDVYRSHPSLGFDLTWLAAHEELIMDENLVSVGQRSAQQRVAMLLIHLFKRAESVGLKDDEGRVPFPVTQQHMSDALGLSLVHTHRTLRRLQHSGLFEIDEGRLAIKKPKALRHLADYYALPLRDRPLI